MAGIPAGADADLLAEVQAIGAHVFLTRDERVLSRASLTGPAARISGPRGLLATLRGGGVDHFGGGTCDVSDCPYADADADADLPAPDLGRWGGLISLFED